ncbi:MAG: amidase [Puia sp.]|nr:amidase [Puia sp.]
MDRRIFLRNGSLAGLGLSKLALVSTSGLSGLTENDPEGNGFRQEDPEDRFELNEATIDELQTAMGNGTFTSVGITQKYLQRIQAIDKDSDGPRLNAIIEINPDALAIAASMDRERKEGKVRGPLHGIPVLVKDNINTADKMMTTAGSLALSGNIVAHDAFIISRLRAAGAVLLGKTNLSEWANFRSSRSTSAWSSRGGQTRCPYILDRNPSGSSSGSGAATTANLCTLAIGTETDGSVVSPSSVNGIVGIKPTVGLWSRSGIIPISATQDTAGPMARTVKDAAILLGGLAGIDMNDPVTTGSNGKSYPDYTVFLDKEGLRGRRIGIEKSHLKGHEGMVGLVRRAMQVMAGLGAVLVEVDLIQRINEIGDAEFKVLLYEFKDGLNRYLAGLTMTGNVQHKLPKNLAEVIAFNERHADKTMPYFKQETLIAAQAKGDLQTAEYTDALAKTLSSRKIIAGIMEEHKLDALSGATNGLPCCIDLANGDYDTGFSVSTPAAIAGFPHITVPMGQVDGLPAGISFIATAYEEARLLAMAYAYEQATRHRSKPLFRRNLLPS